MWASRAAHGYEPTREAAMAAFAKSWRREWAFAFLYSTFPVARARTRDGTPFRGEGSRSRHGLHRVQVGHFDFLRLDDRKAGALADWAFAVIGFASADFANDDAVVAHALLPIEWATGAFSDELFRRDGCPSPAGRRR